jgi:hypothetical protein
METSEIKIKIPMATLDGWLVYIQSMNRRSRKEYALLDNKDILKMLNNVTRDAYRAGWSNCEKLGWLFDKYQDHGLNDEEYKEYKKLKRELNKLRQEQI